ncbi:MAG: bifunctional 4-hydroxy-2-oxoglutarate aldolase/2-dehydro-3-deoxy-phosphogluconate aldolase [Alphaproteobacteria bacterium]
MSAASAGDVPTIERVMTAAPVIPVLTIRREADAVPLARALVAGGLPVLEITLRTDAALAAAAAIAEAVPDALVGLGTLVEPADVAKARAVGARFGVSPGLTEELAAAAAADGLPFLPGVATASELMRARALGFRHLKFFPAEPAGGRAALGGLAGPFPDIRFCPTGGIRADTAASYLALPTVLCVGGSWLATDAEIAEGRWDAITEKARQAAALGR